MTRVSNEFDRILAEETNRGADLLVGIGTLVEHPAEHLAVPELGDGVQRSIARGRGGVDVGASLQKEVGGLAEPIEVIQRVGI